MNCLEGIRIEIKGNKIEQLSQQEYSGKRVYIIIKDDEGNVIESKIDLGVHANMNIEQDTYCFDVCMDDEGASLLINSCEQILMGILLQICHTSMHCSLWTKGVSGHFTETVHHADL